MVRRQTFVAFSFSMIKNWFVVSPDIFSHLMQISERSTMERQSMIAQADIYSPACVFSVEVGADQMKDSLTCR